MFAPDVVAFGSLTEVMVGLDSLIEEQWSQIWPNTRDFSFDSPLLLSIEDNLCVVVAEWGSQGRLADRHYERRGRATLVLRREASGLLCLHSHFSMVPGTPVLRTGPDGD